MAYQRLCEGADECKQEPVDPPVTGNVRGDHVTGMNRIASDTPDGPASADFSSHQNIAKLRVIVGHEGRKIL